MLVILLQPEPGWEREWDQFHSPHGFAPWKPAGASGIVPVQLQPLGFTCTNWAGPAAHHWPVVGRLLDGIFLKPYRAFQVCPQHPKHSHPALLIAALVTTLSSVWREGGQVTLEIKCRGLQHSLLWATLHPLLFHEKCQGLHFCANCSMFCLLFAYLPAVCRSYKTHCFPLWFQVFCIKSEEALCRAAQAHPARTYIGKEAFSIPQSHLSPKLCLKSHKCHWKEEMLCLKPWHPTARMRPEEFLPSSKACPAAAPMDMLWTPGPVSLPGLRAGGSTAALCNAVSCQAWNDSLNCRAAVQPTT